MWSLYNALLGSYLYHFPLRFSIPIVILLSTINLQKHSIASLLCSLRAVYYSQSLVLHSASLEVHQILCNFSNAHISMGRCPKPRPRRREARRASRKEPRCPLAVRLFLWGGRQQQNRNPRGDPRDFPIDGIEAWGILQDPSFFESNQSKCYAKNIHTVYKGYSAQNKRLIFYPVS